MNPETRVEGLKGLRPQYVVDHEGRRVSVILPFDEFVALLEELEDLAMAAERRWEPTVPHEAVLEEFELAAMKYDT